MNEWLAIKKAMTNNSVCVSARISLSKWGQTVDRDLPGGRVQIFCR